MRTTQNRTVRFLIFNREILDELEVNEGCCVYCGRRLKHIKGHQYQFTIDHVIPKSNGGTDCHLNLLPCCRTCNAMKADYSLDYFLTQIRFYLSVNIGGGKNSLKRWRHIEKSASYIKEVIHKYKREIFRYGKAKLTSYANIT